MIIGTIKKIAVTTTAADVNIDYNSFLIENLSSDATVFFKEKSEDGAKCTVNNGFAIGPGQMLDKPLQAKTLSLIGSGSADVRILFLDD